MVCKRKESPPQGYSEKHHIVPKCLGGTDCKSNIVILSGREHFVAHQLLAKIYPDKTGLVWAAIRQARNSNSRAYSWLKEKQAKIIGDKRRGQKISDTHKAALINSRKGAKSSREHCLRISASLMGHKLSEETKEKIRQKAIGRKVSDETRIKLSLAMAKRMENKAVNNG